MHTRRTPRLSSVRERRRGASALAVLLGLVVALATGPEAALGQARPGPPDLEAIAVAVAARPHPRILLSEPTGRARLVRLLETGDPSAARFRQWVAGELAGRKPYGFEPWHAALLRPLTRDDAYCRYAVAATERWVVQEEREIAADQRARVAADSYLHVGSTIGGLALVYDWCHDLLEPAQRARWIAYANQAVWNVWNPKRARWGGATYPWSGWSVDNPSNNYYYSFLRATMLLGLATIGENDQARSWLETFRLRKLEQQLFPTFERDLGGGGSLEGTGYGVAMKGLFELYDWWERSTGERIADRTSHTRASILHMVHSIAPTGDALAPIGDHARDSTASLFDYHREYLLIAIALYPDDRASAVAKGVLASSSVPRMSQGFMTVSDFLYARPELQPLAASALSRTYFGAGTGHLFMRSGWDRDATYAALVCGPYNEAHAHRDQGSFVIHRRGWLAYDQNIASHSGIEQSEDMHNLVRIEQGGSVVKQVYESACALKALAETPAYTYALAVSTGVYRGRAAVTRVDREFLFLRPDAFVVLDRVGTTAGARRVWTLNVPGTASIDADRYTFRSGSSEATVHRISPSGARAEVFEWKALRNDHRGGARIDVVHDEGTVSAFLHVVSLDGSVRSVERVEGTDTIGVAVAFADGRSATASFSRRGTGGTLQMRDAGGAVVGDGPLPSTVAAPPAFAR